MALFTMIMGNGFAAFPVMTGGVGVPVLVGIYDANPAVMAAIGMFSGYCGTLMTPMAANYNMVPVALLELPDKYAAKLAAQIGIQAVIVDPLQSVQRRLVHAGGLARSSGAAQRPGPGLSERG